MWYNIKIKSVGEGMRLKRKSVYVVLITLICVLTFCSLSILVLAIYSNRNNKHVQAADLTIFNSSQLLSFAKDVANGNKPRRF